MHFSVPTSPKCTRKKVKQGPGWTNRRPKNSNLDVKKSPLGRMDAGEDLDLHARTWGRDDRVGKESES